MTELRRSLRFALLSVAGAWAALSAACISLEPATSTDDSRRQTLKVLFLGDARFHKPLDRAQQLIGPLLHRGIEITYTENPDDLNGDTLPRYAALILYANIDRISPQQEEALLKYVEDGGGFVAIHSASACFHNSEKFVALVGGQFRSHGAGVFRTRIAQPDHPVMRGFTGFESWDETYVHARHNEAGRTVLEYREDEPYTWVRTQGAGRVFYTAWGHDERTWGQDGFVDLIERGVRWTAGQDVPAVLASRGVLPPFEYVEQKVAYYPPGGRWGTTADSWTQMQLPLPATESMRHMITPAGFRVELFAAEPDIGKPLCMAWDERGRLWLAETIDYPNEMQPPGHGRDRIRICEDTNGDGRADKFTIFAENLSIPTALTFSRGGVIVHQAPDTLFLKDTDGDDRADVRQVLFTGWGTRDTHAGPSNLQYGLDNWIWGMVGYSGFEGRVGDTDHKSLMAFYRFRPDGSQLEFVRRTNNNTWGFGQSEEGLIFGSTANNNPSMFMPIAARYYESVEGWEANVLGGIAPTARFLPVTQKVRQVDVHGGYTSAAGHALYTARTYPREYWNRIAFVCEPTGHLIGQFILERDGAGYRSHNPTNLLSSDDEWCAPTMAEVGPDGNVWFIDWYNYIVQHNPTPPGYPTGKGGAYETPLRDKEHARVYRIVHENSRPARPMSLTGAKPDRLIAALRHDNLFWRLHAQRLLVERGKTDVVPKLLELVRDTSMDEIGLNVGAIHALWTLRGLGALDGSDSSALVAAVAALRHPSAGVRRAAVLVLPSTAQTSQDILAAGVLNDADAQVRLAALLALADIEPVSPDAGAAIYAMVKQPENRTDRWILEAAAAAGAMHNGGFLAAAVVDRPAHDHSAHAHHAVNLLPNGSFEELRDGRPAGWTGRTFTGQANHEPAESGRTGDRAILIRSSGGADAAWSTQVTVKPHTRYRLSGWIKTQELRTGPGGHGVLLNAHELQPADLSRTRGLKGTEDWTHVETILDSTERTSLTIHCLFGGPGMAAGTAWFDDVSLVEVGPAHPGGAGVEHVLSLVERHVSHRLGAATAAVEDTVEGDTLVLKLATIPGLMRYDRATLTVRAGQKVRLVFDNNDVMQHNFLLLKPGSIEKVGLAADQMITDPQAMSKNFVPDLPEILAATPLVNPQEKAVLEFTAPTVPGPYPYVCTFPGHWRIMQGVLTVEAAP